MCIYEGLCFPKMTTTFSLMLHALPTLCLDTSQGSDEACVPSLKLWQILVASSKNRAGWMMHLLRLHHENAILIYHALLGHFSWNLGTLFKEAQDKPHTERPPVTVKVRAQLRSQPTARTDCQSCEWRHLHLQVIPAPQDIERPQCLNLRTQTWRSIRECCALSGLLTHKICKYEKTVTLCHWVLVLFVITVTGITLVNHLLAKLWMLQFFQGIFMLSIIFRSLQLYNY